MRILGFVLAAAAGFVCWAITLALSDGIAPLGRVDAGVGACFFTPIIFFALPLGVLAAVKGRMLTAAWIGALAPLLGALNFGLAMSSHVGASPDPATFASTARSSAGDAASGSAIQRSASRGAGDIDQGGCMTDSGRLRLLLVLGMLTAFGPMSIDMYLPALPALARNLGSDAAGVQLTLSSFFVGLSLGQLAYGPLADRIGRRPPLIAGIALFVVASAGCAMAGSLDVLIGWRALQAAGACAGMVISRAVVRDRHAPEEAARVLSLLMLVMGLAPILAPLAGGWVLAHAGWRAIFWVLVVFGLACLAAVLAWLPETRPTTPLPATHGDVPLAWYQLLADRRFLEPERFGALHHAAIELEARKRLWRRGRHQPAAARDGKEDAELHGAPLRPRPAC